MKVKKVIEKEIKTCLIQCPYFGVDSAPSGTMVCEHPKAPEDGYIISHPECDYGFPRQCPLRGNNESIKKFFRNIYLFSCMV